MDQGQTRSLPLDVAVRLAIVCGLGVAAVAAVAPVVLIPLALAYPAGLAIKSMTGGSVDGRHSRQVLGIAVVVIVGAMIAVWLSPRVPLGASLAWAAVLGAAAAALIALALTRLTARRLPD